MKINKPERHIVGALIGNETDVVTLDDGKMVRTSKVINRFIAGGIIYIETKNSIYTNQN